MKDLFIDKNASLYETLKQTEKARQKHLIVVNSNKKLLGIIGDGDLRRAILKKKKLNSKISNIYNKKPLFFFEKNNSIKIIKSTMQKKGILFAPIINKNRIVIDFVNLLETSSHKKRTKIKEDCPVMIMAGGKGTRLEPFTNVLPKPLIPVNDKTIIENIIENFLKYNLRKFLISINFKGNIIRSYFGEIKKNYNIKFVEEKEPLGTAGAIKLIQGKVKNNFFVSNSDIIVDIDYNDLLSFHKKNKNIITLVVAAKEYVMPYGSCEINENGKLVQIKEKPNYSFLANTGLYLFNKKIFKYLKRGERLEMDKLLSNAISHKLKIMVYPITEKSWSDVGQWEEYKKTLKKLKSD